MNKFARLLRVLVFLSLGASAARATIGLGLQDQLGNPSSATADTTNHNHFLIQRAQYSLDYSDTKREPTWVSWDLTTGDVGASGRSDFQVDTTLPAGFYQVLTTDYSGSGYDRGHMCPSADRTITVADNQQVFYMSNMVPQAPDNNQGVWASFETECRSLASAGNEILIITGPSNFGGSSIASGVAIPGYTWKIAVVVPLGSGSALSRIDTNTRVIAIKVPNTAGVRSTPWREFVTSAAQIQSDTGYNFFTALSPTIANALRIKVDGQTVSGLPVITQQPTAQSAPVAGAATFTVVADSSSDTAFTYQWFKNDDEIAGATNASLQISPVSATSAGNYTVVVTNSVGSVTSSEAALVVTGIAPSISTQPVARTVSAGSPVSFSVVASGSPTLTYQWRKGTTNLVNGSGIVGANAATLTLANAQAADAGDYNVVVTNSVNSATSANAALTVTPAAPAISTQPATQNATTGSTVNLSVVASGTAPLTYQWFKATTPLANGGNISGADTATLVLADAQPADSGDYSVTVSNGILPNATSSTATVTVSAASADSVVTWDFSTATPSSGLPADLTGGSVAQGNNNGTTTLLTTTSASSGYTGATGGNNAGAAARVGALNTAGGGSAYFEFGFTPTTLSKRVVATAITFGSRSTGTGPTAFTLLASSDNFTSSTTVATGTLLANSTWALQSPTLTRYAGTTGTEVKFRLYGHSGAGSPGANTANWRIDDLKLTLHTEVPTPTAPTIASTSPVDGATAVPGNTAITITFDQPVTVANGWFTLTSAAAGPLSATVTGGPTIYKLTPPISFVEGDTVTVNLVASQITEAASGALHLAANQSFSFTTAAALAPTITTPPASKTVAAGSGVSFTVAASGTAPFTYQWRKNSTPIAGNTSAQTTTLTLTNVQAADAADYDVVVSNGIAPDATSAAATLTVTPTAPTIATQPVATTTATYGAKVSFSVAATGTTPFTYQWRKGTTDLSNGASANGATISGATSATLTLTGVTTSDAGDYNVVVSNGVNPSATSDNASLTVNLPPPGPTVSYTGDVYAQDFGTLPLTTPAALSATGNSVVTLSAASPAGVGATGMDGWSISRYAGSNTTGSSAVAVPFTANNGSSNAGSIYSYGTTSAADRALGALGSGSTMGRFGVAFVNNTTTTLTQVTIRYTGEQWRRGSAAANKLTFAYAIGGHDINIGDFVNAPELDFTAPVTTGSNAALDGNDPANRVVIAPFCIRNITWAPGQTIVLRWTDVDDSGSDDGLAIDDFSFTAAPAIETNPADQTATVGDTVDFSVVVSGTEPFTYQWRKGGDNLSDSATITGTHTATLHLANITTADAAGYYCLVTNPAGSTPSGTAVLTVNKAAATVSLAGLTATYTGSPINVTATTNPTGRTVSFTYDGSATAPTDAGSYTVVGTIVDADYSGSATGTLVINKAAATVTLGNLAATYTGAPISATATTNPSGRSVTLTYNSSSTAPTNAGSYSVVGTVVDTNYAGSATGTLVISPAAATVVLGPLNFTYDGKQKFATATTTPAGLDLQFLYDNVGTPPVNAGSYAVRAIVAVANYVGSATGTLVIAPATQTVAFGALPASPTVGAAFTISATASSGLPVTFSVVSGNATLSGSSLTLKDTAPVTIRATQAGNTNYSAATRDATLTATKTTQTITFAALADQLSNAAPMTLSATATSGLPVTFSVVSGPATVSGSVLTLTGATGAVTVRAAQAGDAAYAAAANVDRTFNVTAAPTAPIITTQPVPQTALIGANVSFSVVATGGTPLSYQWRKDNAPIAGATNATLTLTSIAANAAGGYDVVVTNSLGSTTSALARLTVNVAATAPIITRQPANLALLIGKTATFTVVASGAPEPTYQWRKNGTPIAGATAATLNLTSITAANAGDYSVLIANSAGTIVSNGATLAVIAHSYAGEYFGSLGNGGSFAMHIGEDNTGVFLGFAPASKTAYLSRGVKVDDDGHFTFTLSSPTATTASDDAETPRIAAAATDLLVSGTINSNGSLTAATSGASVLALTGTKAADTGAAAAGFYQAGAANTPAQTLAIIAPNGQAFVLTQSGTTADAGTGTVDASGKLNVTTASQQQIAATVNAATSALSATVTDSRGVATTFTGYNTSAAAVADQRMANISTRTTAGGADQPAIVGFVITGVESKTVLIRAVGPGLRTYGVTAVAATPKLELLRRGSSTAVATNTGWSTAGNSAEIAAAAVRAGAFPLTSGSADSALVATLAPGEYTALVSTTDGKAGAVLVEVYDLSGGSTAQRLANLSTRSQTGTGDATFIAGVVVNGTAPKRVLIRAAGPALVPFGLTGTLARPQLTLFSGSTVIAQNAGWSSSADASAIAEAAAASGAFSFAPGSADAALIVNLAPGAYTAQVTGVNGTNGVVLVEVYEVP